METLFKVDFETDTYELKQNNFGKEVLSRNGKIISTKRNFGFGNKFIIECDKNGMLQLNFKLNFSTTSCEVRIYKDDKLLAQYNESLDHLVPNWAKDKPNEEFAKDNSTSTRRKLIYSLASMVLAVIIWGLIYSWSIAPFLVIVILIHELGHLIAMAAFGYKNKNIIFAPPLGAIAIGTKDDAPAWQKFIVYLSGPLPSIIIGFALLYFDINIISGEISKEIIAMLLTINYFNLLPISPLDGGNIVELMFLHKAPKIQLVLSGIGAVSLAVLGIVIKDIIILIVAALFIVNLISRIKNKDKVQTEIVSVKAWVRWVAALIYLGIWSIAIVIVI